MGDLSAFDLNAAYQTIAERLKTVSGVKQVRGAKDLAQVISGKTTGIDGYVYLIFDGLSPEHTAVNHKHQLASVTYKVVIAVQDYRTDGMPKGIGELMGGVMTALQGFCPIKDKFSLTLANHSGQPAHTYGLSLYPLTFNLNIIYTGAQ